LENKFPKAVPYIYQMAAIMGFGHLLVSKLFFEVFDTDMRFWYNFFYLTVGLANIIAINVYLAISEKTWTLARAWSAAVTFPTVFVSIFFVYNYGYLQGAAFPLLTMDVALLLGIAIVGAGLAVVLSPRIWNTLRRR
jgi:hypothetical protein